MALACALTNKGQNVQNLTTIATDENYPEYPLSIRNDFKGKIDKDTKLDSDGIRRNLATNWQAVIGSAVDLAEHVSSGYAIACASYKGNYRSQENVVDCYLMGLDFDKGLMSAEQAAAHPLLAQIGAVICPTSSDSPQYPKTRVLIFLDRSITHDDMARLKAVFLSLFADCGIDSTVFEMGRLFYGSQPAKERVFVAPHNVLYVDAFLAEYKDLAQAAPLPTGRGRRTGKGVTLKGDIAAEVDNIIKAAGNSLLDFEPDSLGSPVLDQLQYVARLWCYGEPSYALWLATWISAYRASDGADAVREYIMAQPQFWAKYRDATAEHTTFEKAWTMLGERDERAITGATLAWIARKVGWGRHNPYGQLTAADLKLDVIELADALDEIKSVVKVGSNLAIKSQTGSGKTKLNVELIKHLGVTPNRAVVVSPFINLCHSAAEGMRRGGVAAISYDERGAEESGAIVVRTPQNTLKKLPYPEDLDYVFIEEIHTLLHHLTKPKGDGGHMRDDERSGFRAWLAEALRCETCAVVMVDAGLTDVSVDYLRAVVPLTVVHNTGTRRKAKVTRVSEDEALSKAIEQLQAGEKVVVNAASKRGCERLCEVLAPYAESSVLITADTAGESSTKGFRADVEAGAAEAQLVIYNAAMGTGVSIEETRPALIIQYADYLHGSAWIQHLNRYRRQSEVLLVLTLRPPRQSRKTYRDLKGDVLATWRAEIKAEGLKRRDVGEKSGEAQAFDRLTVGLEAARQAELVEVDLGYEGILEADGREYINAIELDRAHPAMKVARELIDARDAAILREWRNEAPIDPREGVKGDVSAESLAKGYLHHRLKRLSNGYLPHHIEPETIAETLLNHATTIIDLEESMSENATSVKGLQIALNPNRGVTELRAKAAKRNLVQMSRTLIAGLFDEITPEKLTADATLYVAQIERVKGDYDAVIATRASNKYAAVKARCEGDPEEMAAMLLKYVLEGVGLKLRSRATRPRNAEGERVRVYTHYIDNAREAFNAMLWRERGRKNDPNIEHIASTFSATKHDALYMSYLEQINTSKTAKARLSEGLVRFGDLWAAIHYALPDSSDFSPF